MNELVGKFSKKELFNASNGYSTQLKDVETGTEITVEAAVVVKRNVPAKNGGEDTEKDIMYIKSADGGMYATESPTVIKNLDEIVDMAADDENDEPITIRLTRAQSKNGRTFMGLDWV